MINDSYFKEISALLSNVKYYFLSPAFLNLKRGIDYYPFHLFSLQ